MPVPEENEILQEDRPSFYIIYKNLICRNIILNVISIYPKFDIVPLTVPLYLEVNGVVIFEPTILFLFVKYCLRLLLISH